MIFVLHYLLFNAGLPAVIILLTLYLQTYSNASLSQIGTLLMVLPFLSVVIKPLFCALADRHKAHREYLMGSIAVMALGYGSLAVAPFFPSLIEEHGNLVWYLDILGIVVGFSAFGVAWSLGDALAFNGAQMAGVTWGKYRVWGVISWGTMGVIIAHINEVSFLPKYVPAWFVLVGSLLTEIVLLALWPRKYFVMCGSLDEPASEEAAKPEVAAAHKTGGGHKRDSLADLESQWMAAAAAGNRSLKGTLTGASIAGGTLHGNPRMIGAVANIFMEDLGGTLRSSLKLGAKPRHTSLGEILDQHRQKSAGQLPAGALEDGACAAAGGTVGKSGSLRRMMLASMGGEGAPAKSAAGAADSGAGTPIPTLGKAAALRVLSGALGEASGDAAPAAAHHLGESKGGELETATAQEAATADTLPSPAQQRSAEDLQLVLLKLIVRRDKTIGKYLVLFTLFGFLLTCHLAYFYLHVERLCREKGNSFSSVTAGMLAMHSISEVLTFLVVPYYIPRVGRIGGLMTCAFVHFVRFAYYGTYFVDNSPYTGVPFEFCHGIAYAIVYSLITNIACECVDQVDEFMPELIERGLIAPDVHPNELKSPLRATMQGVFSGAFDGLGNGIGALYAGIYLDLHPFTSLWKSCAGICLAIMIIYPLTEWRAILNKPQVRRDHSLDGAEAKRRQVKAAAAAAATTTTNGQLKGQVNGAFN